MRIVARTALLATALLATTAPAGAVDLKGLKLVAIPGAKLVVVSKDPAVVLYPDPIDDGATLTVTPAGSAGASVALPASTTEWSETPGVLQKFKNALAPAGSSLCKVAVIKGAKVLKLVCKDVDGLALPAVGDIEVTLQSGATSQTMCFESASIVKNDGTKLIAKKPATTGPCAPPIAGCCGPTRDVLGFTTGVGSGNCGQVLNASGASILGLACGGLYFGGGANSVPLPATAPDYETFYAAVADCNAGTGALTLAHRTQAETGSDRTCTAAGCLYGAPLPIPNATNVPTSTCVINTVVQDLTGTANCASGQAAMDLPLSSEIHLAGDILGSVSGIQPCPVCTVGGPCGSGTCCQGGPNDGQDCLPEATNLGSAGPTSHDCPPDPAQSVGSLPIPYVLTTGTASDTAAATGGLAKVFCGFCWDLDVSNGDGGPGTCSGDPGYTCLNTLQCANAGRGVCQGPAIGCTTDAQCASASASRESCRQKNDGAFSKSAANTIAETGAPAGSLTDGASHAATLVSVFCIPPTFDATVDNAADLPGPGAVSLQGAAQLQ